MLHFAFVTEQIYLMKILTDPKFLTAIEAQNFLTNLLMSRIFRSEVITAAEDTRCNYNAVCNGLTEFLKQNVRILTEN